MNASADSTTLATMTTMDALQACTEACSEWQQEIARFVDLRLAENRRSLEAAMAVRDVAGAGPLFLRNGPGRYRQRDH